ncbi:DsbA family protein [Sphingomonas sp.]|uniref:DsbA family protein n=1 Tax=Sphingomonas sp. TaxID=28214 RepID=UPI002DD68CD4|nr:thioredoxin domain-containing protein [Sphingomonas sp.]
MRIVLALAAVVALTGAAPQGAKDWRATARVSPSGSVLVGNPAAKVKLVEYFSFTCGTCANFARDSKPVLHDSLVRRGIVQVEARAAVRDGFDMAAWAVARCAPAAHFTALSGEIFAQQAAWTAKGSGWVQANGATLKDQPLGRQVRAFADGAGLTEIGARHGLTAQALNACLATPTLTNQLDAMSSDAFAKIPGTPGFEVNGKLAEGVAGWAALQPVLAAAGAK